MLGRVSLDDAALRAAGLTKVPVFSVRRRGSSVEIVYGNDSALAECGAAPQAIRMTERLTWWCTKRHPSGRGWRSIQDLHDFVLEELQASDRFARRLASQRRYRVR